MSRHKWSLKNYKGSKVVDAYCDSCLKCGIVKQYVKGIPTYFRDDMNYDRYAPPCDERLLKKVLPERLPRVDAPLLTNNKQ